MAKRKRNPKNTAWYRSWDNAWYLTEPGKKVARLKDLDGKPIKGESSKLDADKAVARILISGRPADQDEPWTVARACMLYLAELPRKLQRGSIQERHMDQTVGYVKNFMAFCGANQCDNITFADIDAWKAANPSWEKPRHPLSAVRGRFTFCCLPQQGLKIDPMKGYPIPSPGKRVAPFTDEDLAELYAATDDYYADFVKLGSLTGLRSYCELAEITAENMIVSDRGVQLSVSGKMLSGSREKIRIFPLLKEAAEMCLRLAETAPKGSGIPLLRNSKGGKWSRGAAIERMAKLRKKLKWCDDSRKQHLVNYSSRDYFAHGMISGSLTPNRKGVSLEVLAEMMEILQVCSQNTMCRCGAPITMSLCGRRSDSSYFA